MVWTTTEETETQTNPVFFCLFMCCSEKKKKNEQLSLLWDAISLEQQELLTTNGLPQNFCDDFEEASMPQKKGCLFGLISLFKK